MRAALRILFCGEGIALSAVIESARQRGHRVAGVFATSPPEARVMRRSGACVSRPADRIESYAAALQYDLLLSINNRELLGESTVSRAGVAAINYHNGPLPAYAGLRATAWAVFNGERQHGITWHRIAPGIDTGNILVQRCFALSPRETTASLNARCTAAVIESLDPLFACIDSGELEGRSQDFATRSYFRRSDTLPNAGLIDWRWPGERIDRLIRACDWGGVANDFGTATVALPGRPSRFVLRGCVEPGSPTVPETPGEVLGVSDVQVRIACADGVMSLCLDQPVDLRAGERLPCPAPAGEAGDRHKAALRAEPSWLAALQGVSARSRRRDAPPQVICHSLAEQARVLAAVDRVLGGGSLVAVQDDSPSDLSCGWRPVLARMPADCDRPAPLRDLALRQPSLDGLADWWNHVDFRIFTAHGALPANDPGVDCPVTRAVRATMEDLAEEASQLEPSAPQGVLAAILAQARVSPHAPAIESDGEHCTRLELTQRATALAQQLRAAQLRPRAGVGILLARGVDFVVAALAAMLARGAYVPLNLESPDKRRVVEMREGGITHLLTSRGAADTLPALDVQVIGLEVMPAPQASALPGVALNDAAYRIFTSGSSGRPKAVEVTHSALENLCAHYRSRLGLQVTDRVSFLSHPTFDASVADIWPILAAGGTLVIPPDDLLLDPLGLIDWLVSKHVNHAFVPTVVGAQLIRQPWPREVSLRHLLTGGERLPHRPPAPLPFEFINTYGPTENTVDSLWAVIGPGVGPPPIGRPIDGVTVQILDSGGQSLPPGELGELVLGGRQLARGYFAQPALTAAKFTFEGPGGTRTYRTGDRVRLDAGGELEFHGRLDDQVQLHGIRVEPGEIEAILRTDARVREAVCVPCGDGGQVTALSAHVTAHAPVPHFEAELRARLLEHLVPTLVPARIVIHEQLPRTAAGKIDRAALLPSAARPAPRSEDDPLAAIWCSLLTQADPQDAERSFWDLGGTSIDAMKLLLAVHERSGVRVPIAHFLASPTLAGLRTLVRRRPNLSVVKFRDGGGTPLILWYGLSGDLDEFQHLIGEDLGDRSVWGVLSPLTLQGELLPTTIEDAARLGLAALRAHGVPPAASMLGFSWGGLLAFEAARQLAASGGPSAFVCLIGSHPPILPRGRRSRLLHFLRSLPAGVYRKLRHPEPSRQLGGQLRRLVRFVGARGALPPSPAWPTPIFNAHARLTHHRHPPAVVPLELFLVRDMSSRTQVDPYGYVRYDLADLGWSRWTGRPVAVSWMPGDHQAPLTRALVSDFAGLLRAQLAAREARPQRPGHAAAPPS